MSPPDHVDLLGGAVKPRDVLSCNHHGDCDVADEKSKRERGKRAFHCRIDDCEDCYGC